MKGCVLNFFESKYYQTKEKKSRKEESFYYYFGLLLQWLGNRTVLKDSQEIILFVTLRVGTKKLCITCVTGPITHLTGGGCRWEVVVISCIKKSEKKFIKSPLKLAKFPIVT